VRIELKMVYKANFAPCIAIVVDLSISMDNYNPYKLQAPKHNAPIKDNLRIANALKTSNYDKVLVETLLL